MYSEAFACLYSVVVHDSRHAHAAGQGRGAPCVTHAEQREALGTAISNVREVSTAVTRCMRSARSVLEIKVLLSTWDTGQAVPGTSCLVHDAAPLQYLGIRLFAILNGTQDMYEEERFWQGKLRRMGGQCGSNTSQEWENGGYGRLLRDAVWHCRSIVIRNYFGAECLSCFGSQFCRGVSR